MFSISGSWSCREARRKIWYNGHSPQCRTNWCVFSGYIREIQNWFDLTWLISVCVRYKSLCVPLNAPICCWWIRLIGAVCLSSSPELFETLVSLSWKFENEYNQALFSGRNNWEQVSQARRAILRIASSKRITLRDVVFNLFTQRRISARRSANTWQPFEARYATDVRRLHSVDYEEKRDLDHKWNRNRISSVWVRFAPFLNSIWHNHCD